MSIHLTRIYTRSGDKGFTSLTTGQNVSKSHPRLEAYGTLDELISHIGRVAVQCTGPLERASPDLQTIQADLFDIGTLLATPAGEGWPGMPELDPQGVTRLEQWIDAMNAGIPPLTSFVLPGGCLVNADAHVCRTVCRRLERLLVQLQEKDIPVDAGILAYINRLSDYFFVFSRWASHETGSPEVLWKPHRPASSES